MRLSKSPLSNVSEFYSFNVQATLGSAGNTAEWQAVIDICRDNRETPELIHPSVLRAISSRLNRAFWSDNEPFILVPVLLGGERANMTRTVTRGHGHDLDGKYVLIHAKVDAFGLVWAVDPADCPHPWYTFRPEDFEEALSDNLNMNLSYKHSALDRIKDDLRDQDGEVPPLVKIGPGGDYVRVYH